MAMDGAGLENMGMAISEKKWREQCVEGPAGVVTA